jgi:hypothetical protein
MSTIDSEIRQKYLSGRNCAYDNQHIYNETNRLFFINIWNDLISLSPNKIRHIDNLRKIQYNIYYGELFREIYENKNLDLYFGIKRTLKSKEMIVLELYFL